MFLRKIKIKNFRTLEDLQIDFQTYYTAICGKNDSGKSNIIYAIRKLLNVYTHPYYFDKEDFLFKDDYTKWKDQNEESTLEFCFDFRVDKKSDSELFDFIIKYLSLTLNTEEFILKIHVTIDKRKNETVNITIDENKINDKSQSLEILKKIRNSSIIKMHNSMDINDRYLFRGLPSNRIKDVSTTGKQEIGKLNQNISKITKKVANIHQKEITEIVSRLNEKYTVSLNIPQFDIQDIPYEISLNTGKSIISLKDWGSGTQNRTQILINIIEAKKIRDLELAESKITPLLIIEEPESFLHPSAQAEFGKLLQNLSEEFKIQVIVTTHNPFMLSISNASSNILLRRKEEGNQNTRTEVVETGNEKWMEPFGMLLGINDNDFFPFKDLFFKNKDKLLLVEGIRDKRYFEFFMNKLHGENKLFDDITVFAYESYGTLKNQALLKLLKEIYNKIVITYDLDTANEILDGIKSVGFIVGKNAISIGLDQAGKRNIEGLIPEKIRHQVFSENPSLLEIINSNDKKDKADKESAQNNLKDLSYNKFIEKAEYNNEYFGEFYKVIKKINKEFKEKN